MTTPKRLRPIRETLPGLGNGFETVHRAMLAALEKGLAEDREAEARNEKPNAPES